MSLLPRPPVKGPVKGLKPERLEESVDFVAFRTADAEAKAVFGGLRMMSVGTLKAVRLRNVYS